jgi:hypothetical protein
VQSNFKSLSSIFSGIFFSPVRAPIIPPTMHALVSVSPPKLMVSLIAF